MHGRLPQSTVTLATVFWVELTNLTTPPRTQTPHPRRDIRNRSSAFPLRKRGLTRSGCLWGSCPVFDCGDRREGSKPANVGGVVGGGPQYMLAPHLLKALVLKGGFILKVGQQRCVPILESRDLPYSDPSAFDHSCPRFK